MRRIATALVLVLLTATPAGAQSSPFAWKPGAREVARHISDGLVIGQDALFVIDAARQPDRWHALGCAGLRYGITMGTTEIVKRTTHRMRPNGRDDMSFWSGHSASAMAASGWNYKVGVPIAVGAGYMRLAANEHWLTDVLAGLGAGALSNLIRC